MSDGNGNYCRAGVLGVGILGNGKGQMMQPIKQEYFTTKELMVIFGVSRPTLWRWGKAGKFPQPTLKFGRPLWHNNDITAFREAA